MCFTIVTVYTTSFTLIVFLQTTPDALTNYPNYYYYPFPDSFSPSYSPYNCSSPSSSSSTSCSTSRSSAVTTLSS